MDQRTRKLMTMYKALHPIDDRDSPNVSRKGGRSGGICIEHRRDESIQRLKDNIKRAKKDYLRQQITALAT